MQYISSSAIRLLQNSVAKKNKLAAISILEIITVMGVVAVLLGASAWAITITSRNNRDNQRRTILTELNALPDQFFARYRVYPNNLEIDVDIANDTAEFIFTRDGGANSAVGTVSGLTVPAIAIEPASSDFVMDELGSPSQYSRYCYYYDTSTNTYTIGVQLESGENNWYYLGNSADLSCNITP